MSSSYLGFTILLCKYGLPYLPTLPQKKLSKFFFWKKFVSKIPYLPTVWTYVQSFVVFFILNALLSVLTEYCNAIFCSLVLASAILAFQILGFSFTLKSFLLCLNCSLLFQYSPYNNPFALPETQFHFQAIRLI